MADPSAFKGQLNELMAELMAGRPTKAEYTDANGFDSASYSAAVGLWSDGYSSLKGALDGYNNMENGLFELPDGTLIPLEDLDPNEQDAVNQYNEQLYGQAMAKFGLEQYSLARQSAADENDARQRGFENKVTELQQNLGYDDAELAHSAQELDRWLKGQTIAEGDADRIADAKKQVGMYGTTGGKSSFSGNDLGAGVAALARMGGVSGDAPFLSYPGTQTLDPVADRLASLAGMGISNSPPAAATLDTSRSMIPTGPEFMQMPSYSGAGGGGMPTAPRPLQNPAEVPVGRDAWDSEHGITYDANGVPTQRGAYDKANGIGVLTQQAGLPPWQSLVLR